MTEIGFEDQVLFLLNFAKGIIGLCVLKLYVL